jgi:hypothetical protein
MNNQFIKQVDHMPGPVSIEREERDVVVIEGVRYAGDVFRVNAWPNEKILYAIRRNEEGVVCVTEIRDVAGAMDFFDPQWLEVNSQGQGDPAPTEENDDVV